MKFFVPYFTGFGGDSLGFLLRWLEDARRVCGERIEPIALIGDNLTESRSLIENRVDFDVVPRSGSLEDGTPYGLKGALIESLLRSVDKLGDTSEPFVVMDFDTRFEVDPVGKLREIAKTSSSALALAPDCTSVLGRKIASPCRTFEEMNSGVMLFNRMNQGERGLVADMYRQAWYWCRATDRPPVMPELREQRAWSLVFHWLRGKPLPGGMNRSYRETSGTAGRWANDPTFIRHYHGEGKELIGKEVQHA